MSASQLLKELVALVPLVKGFAGAAKDLSSVASEIRKPFRSTNGKMIRRGMESFEAHPGNDMSVYGPTAVGVVTTFKKFSVTRGAAQKIQQYSGDSCRIHGTGFLCRAGFAVQGGGNNESVTLGGSASCTAALPLSYVGGTTNVANHVHITPSTLGPRLAQEAAGWSFSAFRNIRVRYVPIVASTSSGGFAMSLIQDVVIPEDTASFTPTLTQVMESENPVFDGHWLPAELGMSYNGSKVWHNEGITTGTLATVDAERQLVLLVQDTTGSLSTAQGYFIVEYVCDFYLPSMIIASASQPTLRNGSLRLFRPSTRIASFPVVVARPSRICVEEEEKASSEYETGDGTLIVRSPIPIERPVLRRAPAEVVAAANHHRNN
jgi:hypothetical protein